MSPNSVNIFYCSSAFWLMSVLLTSHITVHALLGTTARTCDKEQYRSRANDILPSFVATNASPRHKHARRQPLKSLLAMNFNHDGTDSVKNQEQQEEDLSLAMARMEKEVRASVQANLDMKKVKKAFALDDLAMEPTNEQFLAPKDDTVATTVTSIGSSTEFDVKDVPSQGRVALAGGITTGIISYLLFHQPLLSYICFFVTTYYANRDPIEEGPTMPDTQNGLVKSGDNIRDAVDDDVVGPIARIVGRATLQSLQETKPKVRAISRAAATGSAEIDEMKEMVQQLQEENASLRTWIKNREMIDDNVGKFKADELKAIAREEGLTVGGTKRELLVRLVDAGCLDLERFA